MFFLSISGFAARIKGYSTNKNLEDSWDASLCYLQQKLKIHKIKFFIYSMMGYLKYRLQNNVIVSIYDAFFIRQSMLWKKSEPPK